MGLGGANASSLASDYSTALEPFLKANPDISVQVTQTLFRENVSQIVGGVGDDIIHDIYCPPYWQGDLLLPLDPLLKRDGIDTSIWTQGQLKSFMRPSGLFMLGDYFSPFVYVVNLSVFDALGLPYPTPDWTATDFVDVCESLTATNAAGQKRIGAILQWDSSGGIGPCTYILNAFGGGLTDPTGMISWLDKPGSIAAGKWIYEQLLWPGVAIPRHFGGAGVGVGYLTAGTAAMTIVWGGALEVAAALQSTEYAFLPFPVFPAGRTTMGTSDFYGINVQTKHPEEAWRLLRWVTAEPSWQTSLMQINGAPPTLINLWEKWEYAQEQVAPVLKGKGLHWWVDAAVKGYALPESYYRYDDAAVQAVVSPFINSLSTQSETSVSLVFTSAAQAATAAEQQAATVAGAVTKEQAAASGVSAGQNYASPPRTGAGVAAISAPQGTVQESQGTWTLIGGGTGLGGVSDQCVFAALAQTQYSQKWVCELSALANAGQQPWMSQLVQVGLMARSDLSGDAMLYAVSATGNGIATQVRGRIGIPMSQTAALPANPQGKSGYIAPQYLLRNFELPGSNYLQQPVWLQLERQGTRWTASTSLDGKTWTAVGSSVQVPMGGVWVGVFATGHNATGAVQAVFDQLNFTPDTLVEIGAVASKTSGGKAGG